MNSEKILNPSTGRYVKKDGVLGRKIIKEQNEHDKENKIFKINVSNEIYNTIDFPKDITDLISSYIEIQKPIKKTYRELYPELGYRNNDFMSFFIFLFLLYALYRQLI